LTSPAISAIIYTVTNPKGTDMFESIEIRRVENGFVVAVTTEGETKEYVYDTSRKALRVIKGYLESKAED
jgi:hypothetical protein